MIDQMEDTAANKLMAFMWIYALKYNNADVVKLATGYPKEI